MIPSIVLVHLGEFIPTYLRDCVHQLRIWSPSENSRIYIILEPFHRGKPFWTNLIESYDIHLCFTDELEKTTHHMAFLQRYKEDMSFRNGYWRHVKERFFYMEELMQKERLQDMIAMEYDVLLYTPVEKITDSLRSYANGRLCYAMDTDIRGQPGFMFIGSINSIRGLNIMIVSYATKSFSDMNILAFYKEYYPDNVATLPMITPARNVSISKRVSLNGHEVEDTSFLSDGFEDLGVLFDGSPIGQFIAGVDPRNPKSEYSIGMINEAALYSAKELELGWGKLDKKWIPILDGQLLITVHMHSKALAQFLSNRTDLPQADYDIATLKASLEPNEKTA
jgi:hypothetical protein